MHRVYIAYTNQPSINKKKRIATKQPDKKEYGKWKYKLNKN